MIWILLICAVLLLLVLPNYWVNKMLDKYSVELDSVVGSGYSLAQHFNHRFQLAVEVTDLAMPSNYDPIKRSVNVENKYAHKKSLTSVAVAAHEMGHALQHFNGEKLFYVRTLLAQIIGFSSKFVWILWLALPALTYAQPRLGFLLMLALLTWSLLIVCFHLITLPIEWNASFGKALPILEKENYLPAEHIPILKKILYAAVFTYVANALLNLLFVWRIR